MRYHLIHITTQREYKTPLVASQLFDQAQCQATDKEGFAPYKVHAWIIEPMREYFSSESKAKLSSLRNRCPNITIKMIPGINRLNDFPARLLLAAYRRSLNTSIPVIYHCRGEIAAKWALELRARFPQDKVMLDVRGLTPAEYLYEKNIVDPDLATGEYLSNYLSMKKQLTETILGCDAITTVSDPLRKVLIAEMNAPATTTVVPCCLKTITLDEKREKTRKRWNANKNDIVLVYSGTTAAYQHLEDLTFPFVRSIMALNPRIKLALLTPQPEEIKKMAMSAGIDPSRLIIESLPQKDVAFALTGADAGLLIRKPTLVNRVAHPVKIAEYLASGVPLIVEKGVGGISDSLYSSSVAKAIQISSAGSDFQYEAIGANQWLEEDIAGKREKARGIARSTYLWSSAIKVHRKTYQTLLGY